MNAWTRACAAALAALVIGVSFAPPTASAQAQMQYPPPPPPPAPGGPAPIISSPYEPTQADRVGAGFLNVVYVPGKAIVCSVGTLASAGLMLLTFGSAYHEAVELFQEGCAGKWVLTPYDVAAKRPPEESY